jgi:hypothetical protein
MDHNYVRDENFCILTIRREKDNYHLTGNSKNGIKVGDTINYIVNDKLDILGVTKVLEIRDDKSFPKGNNLWFNAVCGIITNPNPKPKTEKQMTL